MPEKPVSNKKIIEDMHKNARISDLRLHPIKESILKGASEEVLANIPSIDNRQKAEMNALLSIFIEEIWLSVLEKIRIHPPGFLEQNTRGEIKFLTERDLMFQIATLENAQEVMNFLFRASKFTIRQGLKEWKDRRDKIYQSTQASGDMRDIAYRRYVDMSTAQEGRNINDLHSGLNTAIQTSFDTIRLLPEVFKQQFGRDISLAEFKALAQNALPLIYTLASSHLGVFSKVNETMFAKKQINIRIVDHFIPERFYFRQDLNGKLFLEIKPEFLEEVAKDSNITTQLVRTKCPAMYSMGPSHRNVIAETHNWIIDLAEKYYFPALEKEQNEKK